MSELEKNVYDFGIVGCGPVGDLRWILCRIPGIDFDRIRYLARIGRAIDQPLSREMDLRRWRSRKDRCARLHRFDPATSVAVCTRVSSVRTGRANRSNSRYDSTRLPDRHSEAKSDRAVCVDCRRNGRIYTAQAGIAQSRTIGRAGDSLSSPRQRAVSRETGHDRRGAAIALSIGRSISTALRRKRGPSIAAGISKLWKRMSKR